MAVKMLTIVDPQKHVEKALLVPTLVLMYVVMSNVLKVQCVLPITIVVTANVEMVLLVILIIEMDVHLLSRLVVTQMLNVLKIKFADCLKDVSNVFLLVQLYNVVLEPFALQEIMLASVLVLLVCLLEIHMEEVAKMSIALKMMIVHQTSIVIDFHILV